MSNMEKWLKLTENFDSSAEPSMQDEFIDIYNSQGEEALADALGLTPEQLEQEISEVAATQGLHADDDREEIIYRIIDDTVSNADIDTYGESSMNEIEQLRKLSGLQEGYPGASDPNNREEYTYNSTKSMGADAPVNARATSQEQLKQVLAMAGLDPSGAEKHDMEDEPDSVKVVDVSPADDSPCGGAEPMGSRYTTDKTELIDMLKSRLQQKMG